MRKEEGKGGGDEGLGMKRQCKRREGGGKLNIIKQ